MGIGDRFAREGVAQLQAFRDALARGVEIIPVWNKSNREHLTVDTQPESVRTEAEAAVRSAGWHRPYFVDADHINLGTVDRYIDSADFFTIDVGDAIGGSCIDGEVAAFTGRHRDSLKSLDLSSLGLDADLPPDAVAAIACKYLPAVRQAAATYRRIVGQRGNTDFVTEVSMDETDAPQSPQEIFLILAALADEQIPLQTIAPKFSGRFNKGVDYVGNIHRFATEFEADVLAVHAAVRAFGLPANLKLSIHSGSDKFAIYDAVAAILKKHDAGVHVKTAGTTWLAEVEGLIEAGGDGLAMAKVLYAEALAHIDELCAPYASVLDVQRDALPAAATVDSWAATAFRDALLHDCSCPRYNPNLRQLMHVAYKLAAKKGERWFDLLATHREIVGRRVTANLDRHIRLIFG
jgi:hypothetical protein